MRIAQSRKVMGHSRAEFGTDGKSLIAESCQELTNERGHFVGCVGLRPQREKHLGIKREIAA
jgi:hypothetical protein